MVVTAGVAATGSATAEVTTFPDGTEVEITIDAPADGSSPVDGSALIEGTARVGAGDTPKDTSLVVVYDLSGSTLDPSGGDCGGDVNGDGNSNTILDCEIAAMEALEATAVALGSVAEMGVTLFELGSQAADLQPGSGIQRLTVPGADLNANGMTDIADVVRTSRWTSGWFSADATVTLFTRLDAGTGNGGTNYSAGLSNACDTLAATSQPNRTIVFLSDGGANRGSDVTTVLPCSQPATVHSVAVGLGSTCAGDPSGLGSLQEVADLTGGTCTEVTSPEDLPDIISGIISPEIYRLGLSVNGGPEIDMSSNASVTLPARGPDPLDWTYQLDDLAGPVDEVCATVYARRDLELVEATECITLISDRPPVPDAGPDQIVLEGALIELDGTASFDPDDDPLSYSWEIAQQQGAPIVLSSTTEPVAAFIAFDDGEYDLTLTVSDGRTSVSDSVTVTVNNDAPVATALAEPASEGGVALVTASFTDAGLLDTHTATIDWGDGSGTQPVDISAQGNGWGSLFGTHVYGGPGSFTAVITITDDDGGVATVESIAVEVQASLALWANSETAGRTINWVGGGGTVEGLVHSNNELRIRGASKTVDGPVELVGNNDSGDNAVFTQPPVHVTPSDYPVEFVLGDYAPGGRAAVDAGSSYFDMSTACGDRWDPIGPLAGGLYYAPCDVKLNSSAITGTVTVVATGDIDVSGSGADFEPFIDGLLFLSGSSDDKAMKISVSGSTFLGYLYAADGRIDIGGSGNTYLCGILADRINIADNDISIRASDCVRPKRTVAPPTLVPELGLDVDVTPESVLPGTVVDTTTTVSNTGSLLLVPGVVGLENLGAADVTVTAIELGIEYLPVGGSWTPISEAISISSSSNPSAGVVFAPDGAFAGTVVGPDGLATWGAEMQVFLPAATVSFLLDDTQVAAVRNTFDLQLDNPTGEPVRNLFRFGNDFADELRTIGSDLSDVRVVATATDGSTAIIDSSTEPALATLGAGETASVTLSAPIPVPELRGVIEPVDSYRARLAALDNTELGGSAFALASGGVGTVLGPFGFDTTVRHVPIAGLELVGPDMAVAGDTASYELELRNTGAAAARAVSTDVVVDGDVIVLIDAPTELVSGAIENLSFDRLIPADEPVGFVIADATTTWQDANGNVYGDVSAQVSTEIGTPPNLAALLSDRILVDADGSGLPSAGDTIRYTATVTNRGSTPATGVAFSVDPDAQSTLVIGSVNTSHGTATSGNGAGDTTVAVDLGAIGPMSSAEITFDVVIQPGAAQLTVQGLVTSDDLPDFLTDDPGENGSADPTVTRVVETPPSIQAVLVGRLGIDADGDGFIGANDTVEYAVQLTNSGLTSATSIEVTVEPDPNTALVIGSVDAGGGTVVEGNNPGDTRVVVSYASLAGLAQENIEYAVTVNDPIPAGVSSIVSQGTVTSAELADVLTDDPTAAGSNDPTTLPVVVITGGGGGGGGGGTGGPAPTFDAVEPPDGQVITEPIDIAAGITPPAGTTIDSWRVVAYPAGGTIADGIVLNTGVGDPPPGTLATFDPTVVSNGTWVIVVEATDSDGGIGVSTTSVTVEGQLKLGRYAVSYEDASVSVGGIPLRVIRTYDTVRRTSSDDYGYGWSLDVANFEVATNRPLGDGPWSAESCGGGLIFVPLCFTPDGSRRVNVTWPSGRVESFDLRPTGNTFLSILMTAKYEARPGTTSTLRPAPGTETGWLANGSMNDGFFGSGDVYDPQRFLLVGEDGTEYLLDRDDGLVKATDRYGNTVTYTDDGIFSSQGPALTFDRDAEGRIVTLTEPNSSTVSYTYDAAGDLTAVTDQVANLTTFTYDTGHYLSVIDDAGPGPYRTLNYGPDGRVESITDAEGNTTAISVDVGSRSQVVTEPDGNSTRVTSFDERGNATTIDHVYDGQSHVTTLAYDGSDNVTSRTDPNGDTWSLTWDTKGNMTSYTDPVGSTTTYEYGAFNLPVTITDAMNNARTFEYNAVGDLLAVNHPVGATSGLVSALLAGGAGTETFTYDSAGNLLTTTDALGAVWTLRYDSNGNVVEHTDPLGQSTNYTYDGSGRLLTTTDAEGATTAHTYDANGNLTSTTDPLNRTTTWTYDARDLVTEVTDPLGFVTSYTYDDLGNVTSETDPTGSTWSWAYAYGRNVSMTAPDGAITTYGYDASGRLESVTDPLGRLIEYGYDIAGRWITTDYPFGDGQVATTTNVLDGAGFRVGYIDGRGGSWTYTRDALGRLTEETNPLGEVTARTYDAVGRPLSEADGLGNLTAYSYDAAGQLSAITAPDNEQWTYSYDLAGNQTTITDPLSRVTSFGYDATYRETSSTDAGGNTSTTQFDDVGQTTSSTMFGGVTTTFTYDNRGLMTSSTDDLGNTTSWTYDAAGRQSSMTDPRGNTTTYDYDIVGREEAITDALGENTNFEYDIAGQMTAVVDPDGNRRLMAYDDLGLPATKTDPLGRTVQNAYDAEGNQISVLDPRGILVEFEFDAAGRMIERSSPSETISYTYDAAGRRSSMTDATGQTTWDFDATGRLAEVTAPGGVVAYGYDAVGQMTTMTQPEGTTNYTYDSTGYLSQIDDWSGNNVTVASDPDGRIETINRSSGTTTAFQHDPAGRVLSVAHSGGTAVPSSYVYTLDGNGNRTSGTATENGSAVVETYVYDDLDRLVSVDYGDGVTEAFTYNASGSRTQQVIAGGPDAGTTTYSYDAAQQLTDFSDGTTVSSVVHDAAGNVLNDGLGSTFSWDAFGRMTAGSTDGQPHTYRYDGDDVRVEVNGVAQVWDRRSELPYLLSSGAEAFSHLDGQILAEHDGTDTRWSLSDALGSVRSVTDASGSVIATQSYGAYGDIRSSSGTAPTFGFTGEQTDATGLVFLRSRSYSPNIARFLSPDTVQPNAPGTQGWNLYGYANANPTTNVDPSGHVASVEYASLLRNSVITQVALRLLGLCIKGILEGIAFGLLFAEIFGYDYEFEWEWALVDCAIEIIFAGFGPNGGRPRKPPKGDPPKPKPDTPPVCKVNSFEPDTLVLMADGTLREISSIKVGDLVLAADPTTGETGPWPVTHVITGRGVKNIVDVGVGSDNIAATDDHLFWEAGSETWTAAQDLERGDALLSDVGTLVEIRGTQSRAAVTDVFNLSVDGLHTYFVGDVDSEPILVHNEDFQFGTFVNEQGVKISIHPNDHGPPHAHVDGGGGKTRIGQNGKPLDGDPPLTKKQSQVVKDNLGKVRNQISKYMKWFRNNGC